MQMAFSEFMKKKRVEANVTQRTLSAETGYSVAFIGSWEQGKAYPPRKVLGKLGKLLGISPELLEKEVLKCKIERLKQRYSENKEN